MLELNLEALKEQLRLVPLMAPLCEMPERSEHLEEKVFKPLREGRDISLSDLDFSIIAPQHLVPEYYPRAYAKNLENWCKGFISRIKSLPAASASERTFI